VKVVLDTNVVVSGIFFGGPPQDILVAAYAARFHPVLSPEILDEYRRAVHKIAVRSRRPENEGLLELLLLKAELRAAAPLSKAVCDDPDDDKFLACALASGAPIIVSGDRELLAVSGYRKLRVITPRTFCDERL